MNRAYHLKQTLPVNILHNKNYKNLEFVILDYNSSDDMEDFIKETFICEIETGRLKYYKTLTPLYFNRSHSRNLVCKLAEGDIICNIDADNYTGEDFAHYINDEFKRKENAFLTAMAAPASGQDVLGRSCVKRNDFYSIKGYDERMINYGFEDYDFVNRLELSGLNKAPIAGKYLKAIPHAEEERLSNESVSGNLQSLLLNYLTPSCTEFLFLFKDNTYSKGIVIDNQTFKYPEPLTEPKRSQLKYEYSVYGDMWMEGGWNMEGDKLELSSDANVEELRKETDSSFLRLGSLNSTFYELSDSGLILDAVMFFSQVTNRILMERNKLEKRIIVNDDFGKDIVYKNFDNQTAFVT